MINACLFVQNSHFLYTVNKEVKMFYSMLHNCTKSWGKWILHFYYITILTLQVPNIAFVLNLRSIYYFTTLQPDYIWSRWKVFLHFTCLLANLKNTTFFFSKHFGFVVLYQRETKPWRKNRGLKHMVRNVNRCILIISRLLLRWFSVTRSYISWCH